MTLKEIGVLASQIFPTLTAMLQMLSIIITLMNLYVYVCPLISVNMLSYLRYYIFTYMVFNGTGARAFECIGVLSIALEQLLFLAYF